MDPNTVRVLSIDGGGVRGYLPLKFLQNFVEQWGIQPDQLHRHFDVIAGTSIGGILALGIANGININDLDTFFINDAKRLFTNRTASEIIGCDANTDSNRPNLLSKLGFIAESQPLYQSACPNPTFSPNTNSNYGSVLLPQILTRILGTTTLNQLQTNVIIPAYQDDTSSFVNFSNYTGTNMFIGQMESAVNVALATSAAPIYLPSITFGGHRYIDGGVYQNNPASTALTLAYATKPNANRAVVLSLGTGSAGIGFNRDAESVQTIGEPNFIERIFGLFNIASTGGQEGVDFNLRLRANNTLEQLFYYRFQPELDSSMNTELDNSDASFLTYMETLARSTFVTDAGNINRFIAHLTA